MSTKSQESRNKKGFRNQNYKLGKEMKFLIIDQDGNIIIVRRMIKIRGKGPKPNKGQPQWAKDMENRILTYVDTRVGNVETHIDKVESRMDNLENLLHTVIKVNNLKTK